MKYGILFTTVAVLLAASALLYRGWHLLLLWPAVSCLVIAAGYFHFGPRVYGKSPQGLLSPWHQLLLLPYLLYMRTAWRVLRLVKREAAFHQLADQIIIGRRLLSHELPDGIDHVVDLTCEFAEPQALRATSYYSFQILDGFVPPPERLRQWVALVASLPGKVYIHCAEGHGRTGLFAAALLVYTGRAATVDDAIQMIQSMRPQVRLGRKQMAVLRAAQRPAL